VASISQKETLEQPQATGDLGAPVAAPLAPKGSANRVETVLRIVLPILVIAAFLFLWQILPGIMGFQTYEFPPFWGDVQALVNQWGTIGPSLKVTIVDALVGFALGNLLAVIGAVLFVQSKYIEWSFYPLAIIVQTIPTIVLAPLFVVILATIHFGPYDPLPIVGIGTKPILMVTILITFFPTLVNMTVGLKAVDPNLYDFMRLINASRWTILWRLRLPSSMPYLFSSFKITSTLCFIGAVVGEWMLASASGIGGMINIYNYSLNKVGLWASILALSVSCVVFFGIVVVAERLLVPWREER
jgi:NitT/TauT family transport system permease protein